MGEVRKAKTKPVHSGREADGFMENQPPKPRKTGADDGGEREVDTHLAPGQTLVPQEETPPQGVPSLGSTRVFSTQEKVVLAVQDENVRPPLPVGQEGSILGDFQILKKLGEGAMGAVFL